ncbi:2Fe-2S iron-sulfur cluster-binding protein [Stagnihabitans tardus]|uniref:nitric oxide dioxygenase n=1 Tax=Stagnihabitans tardus TaxID=2699202 RepID=A0AAE4YCG3_9RHOB|nr:2Fe-2S iron-sulfur cluster-binding protein [Stagnihabitans tardus]NBZ90106.1 2Fe-2S iron-sulfur cluster binding domain-containing protein [Stagnihabitans tardus]
MSSPALSLKVVAKRQESRLIASFLLEPEGEFRPFRPGQFLVFRLPGGVIRNYSLSGAPDAKGQYRITVKREAMGQGSGHLHDQVSVGDVLQAEGPRGDFVLHTESPRPVVLLAGGVGLTPLLSMLHHLAQTDRRTLFVHAVENGADHPLREEVLALAARPNVTAHFCYRAPTDQDRAEGRFHSEGFLSKATLQALLPLDDYDFYLCGPPAFMQACYAILRDLGVARDRIAHEFFGPASQLDPAPAKPAPVASQGNDVTFLAANKTAPWDDSPSLLDFAETQGLQPAFSCRAGVCGTCVTRLVEGSVDWTDDPLDPPPEGHILLCCTRPKGAVVLEL